MKKAVFLAFVLALLSSALFLWVADPLRLQMVYASPYTDISVSTAHNMITNGLYPDLVVLDVRTKGEYDSGHIYGAVWIPYTELDARINELAGHENHDIIVYCRSGGRSVTASQILDSHNFTKVYNMLGGILAWQSAGYPVWIATVHNVNTTFNYDTIQAAIDAPQTLNGHKISVDAGTYYEHVVVNKALSLIGENRSTTIIDGNGTGTVVKLDANNTVVSGFAVRNGDYGVLISSDRNNISDNTITDNKWDGLFASGSDYNNISNNIISNNTEYGIEMWGNGNTIFGNKISNNEQAVSIMHNWGDNPNILKENEMIGNRYGLAIYDGHLYTYHLYAVADTSNTVDGKPVYYLINQSNLIIDPSTFPEIGYLGVANSSNIMIRDLVLSRSGQGIRIADSENVTILNVTVSNNRVGISTESIGWRVNCSILDSKIVNNEDGLSLLCSNASTVHSNTISNNTVGMDIGGMSTRNLVTDNLISNNREYGIGIYYLSSGGNILYHNSFIDNTKQVYKEYTISPNIWDNGYPSGGNYWSDYSGVDLYSGPYQNETGGDGIGDTPYVIDASNQDNYPFTAHDVAVTNVTLSKTVVSKGYNVTINITAKNVGHYTETFNISLYADKNSSIIGDEIVIGNQTVHSLTSGNSTILTFTWSTADISYGNYTLSACATSVPNERSTTDNLRMCWVVITMVGDVDGDFDCDADDVFTYVSPAYGTEGPPKKYPADPNYNPNCDFDGDGDVDADDVFIYLAPNYGRSC